MFAGSWGRANTKRKIERIERGRNKQEHGNRWKEMKSGNKIESRLGKAASDQRSNSGKFREEMGTDGAEVAGQPS